MKKKKLLQMVICIVLLAVLLLVYFILRNHNEKPEENTDTAIQVLDVAASDITSICFRVEDQEEIFALKDGIWKLEKDESFEVDGDKLNSLILVLTGMTADRKLEAVPDIGEYGLNQPVQTAVLTDKNGNTHTIYWGSSNASTGVDYIYLDNQTDIVYTVSYSVLESFSETLENYKKQEAAEEEGED